MEDLFYGGKNVYRFYLNENSFDSWRNPYQITYEYWVDIFEDSIYYAKSVNGEKQEITKSSNDSNEEYLFLESLLRKGKIHIEKLLNDSEIIPNGSHSTPLTIKLIKYSKENLSDEKYSKSIMIEWEKNILFVQNGLVMILLNIFGVNKKLDLSASKRVN